MAVSFKNENSFNFLSHLMISFIFYSRFPPFKSVTMATRNALFPIFKFQKFTNTYLGKVTKFEFNCFSRLGLFHFIILNLPMQFFKLAYGCQRFFRNPSLNGEIGRFNLESHF